MALRKVLLSTCEKQFASCLAARGCVRYARKYRDQHEKQAISQHVLDEYRSTKLSANMSSPFINEFTKEELLTARSYKSVHPEFMPDADSELRDPVKEAIEREDMMKRRAKLDIPEFYVGTIMAVTLSDPYAQGNESRFVGICIERGETGLRHNFTLRNVIDKQGIEIMYELYNPTIKKIEVIRLEKRLDDSLLYLRDAPDVHSTVPFDLETTPHPKGAAVPVNQTIVTLNPRPWRERWERKDLQGVTDVSGQVSNRSLRKAKRRQNTRPWEKYDLMKIYRESIPLDEQDAAYVHFAKEQVKLERQQAAELDKQIESEKKNLTK